MTEDSRKATKNSFWESGEHKIGMADSGSYDLDKEFIGSSREYIDIFHSEIGLAIDRRVGYDCPCLHVD